MRTHRGEVVVGVDGSDASWDALEWAAEEAQLTDATLAILHCQHLPLATSLPGAPMESILSDTSEFDQAIVDEAMRRVAQKFPGAAVHGESVLVPSAVALLEASREARLVVVGSHSHGRLAGLMLGSTALQVALHAACPAAVVRPRMPDDRQPFRGHVVVGVDGSEGARAALAVAFDEAAQRGAPLAAVYAEPVDAVAGLDLVATEVEPWQQKYPGVAVTQAVTHTDAAHSLLRCTSGAELLVVGSRGHGGFAGLLLGSVGLAMVQRARCPVLVAHDDVAAGRRREVAHV